ncbi:hypothetical protein [Mucilaginibacter sp. 10I4]|uniref:hypothetical protein n=1 Tax=Mucilaginibacter sp. 10I4 TaxID=3048580 RepID=UPI002B221F6A|nr:hypothetical protein [Mucilaginibacter sp. 10I4]MEB0263166.1 hypothetical protein [Mucilaginibacter sp. 10I4]
MVAVIAFIPFKGQPKEQHFKQAVALDAFQFRFAAAWAGNSVCAVLFPGGANNC